MFFFFRKWANLCQRYRLHWSSATVIQVDKQLQFKQKNDRLFRTHVCLTVWDLFALFLTEQLFPHLRWICQMKLLISAISCGLRSAVPSVPVSTILRMVSGALKIVKKVLSVSPK